LFRQSSSGIEKTACRAAGGAEEIIEANVGRSVFDRAGKIGLSDFIDSAAARSDRVAVVVQNRHAHVPLADASGDVTLTAQQLGNRVPARFDQRAIDAGKDTAQARAKTHPACQQAVPRRSADGRRAVRVGEADAFGGQPVEIRRGNLGLRGGIQ
jgi:hypothetical protein